VAVGRRARDLSRRQAAVGAGLVLDDHGLAQRLAQAVAERARDQVDRAARGLRQDEADGLRRIWVVGARARVEARHDRECGSAGKRNRRTHDTAARSR
jgi:hypothetical protein